MRQRLQDLGSPAGSLVEPLLPADPTLEIVTLAEAWEPAGAPQRIDHYQVATHDVQTATDFWTGLGMRLTEYTVWRQSGVVGR